MDPLTCQRPDCPVEQHAGLLRDIAGQLNRWADESRRGGWSTHQVKPQLALAAEIHQHLDRHPV